MPLTFPQVLQESEDTILQLEREMKAWAEGLDRAEYYGWEQKGKLLDIQGHLKESMGQFLDAADAEPDLSKLTADVKEKLAGLIPWALASDGSSDGDQDVDKFDVDGFDDTQVAVPTAKNKLAKVARSRPTPLLMEYVNFYYYDLEQVCEEQLEEPDHYIQFHMNLITQAHEIVRQLRRLRLSLAPFRGGSRVPSGGLVFDGATTLEIARRVEVSEQTIRNARRDSGVNPKKRGGHAEKYTALEIYRIACARKKRGAKSTELELWNAFLRAIGQPALGV